VGLRINEAEKLGFKYCIIPRNNYKNLDCKKDTIELAPVSILKEAFDVAITEVADNDKNLKHAE
jgi:predicted ATP-dependent protease